METDRKVVVVTGFGPFGEHAVNASWIAVQEFEKLGLRDSVDLHVYVVPVEYQVVQRMIPGLWKEHRPRLVVHVGVSSMATTVTLEKCGHNVGYSGLDNSHFCPGSRCCVEGGPEWIDSVIDLEAVCKRITASDLDVAVSVSKDAGRCASYPPLKQLRQKEPKLLRNPGNFDRVKHVSGYVLSSRSMRRAGLLRYLCDFTYYTSLYHGHGRSAFVHVPPLNKPYSAEQLGRALQAIIEAILDVLEQSENKINCCHEC